jgi:hypothetical protein
LKQTDYDGKDTYSKLVAVEFDGPAWPSLRAYPSPFNGKKITLEIKGFKEVTDIPVQIYNLLGQKVMERILTTNKSGTLKQDVTFDSTLPSGVYIVRAGPSLGLTQRIEVQQE